MAALKLGALLRECTWHDTCMVHEKHLFYSIDFCNLFDLGFQDTTLSACVHRLLDLYSSGTSQSWLMGRMVYKPLGISFSRERDM